MSLLPPNKKFWPANNILTAPGPGYARRNSTCGTAWCNDVVVVLRDPALDADGFSYQVDILDGEMSASGGASSLFIDVIGRPLTPLSIAGVHRRGRRHGRRRERRRLGRRMMY